MRSTVPQHLQQLNPIDIQARNKRHGDADGQRVRSRDRAGTGTELEWELVEEAGLCGMFQLRQVRVNANVVNVQPKIEFELELELELQLWER